MQFSPSFTPLKKFKIGDVVKNTWLSPKNAPITGGFPWSRESLATIISFHPEGTSWCQHKNTGPNTYLIQYELQTQWGTEWNCSDRIYPAHPDKLELADSTIVQSNIKNYVDTSVE